MFIETHIPTILSSTACVKHVDADVDVPCYKVESDTADGPTLRGVCGVRIRQAGYNGVITPQSLSQRTPGGRNHGRTY